MAATIIEKILARTSGAASVRPGDLVVAKPDQVMFHDLQLAIEGLWYRPKKLSDVSRVSIVYDHAVPAPSIRDASGMKEGRRFAAEFGIERFYDLGQHGICHVVAAEQGLARPGELLVCPDSHTCASGALNCAGQGTGVVEMLQAMTKGELWYIVAPTVRYEFEGSLAPGVSGKDVFFHIAQLYGGHSGTNMEFGGAGLKNLPMSDRRTIATMCAEVSAEFAVFEYDDVTASYLEGRLDRPVAPAHADVGAVYQDVRVVHLDEIEPYVMRPDFIPKNGVPVNEFAEHIKIDQAFIGSCANGQIEDLRVAANLLAGRHVAGGVRLLITPGSQAIYLQAAQEGLLATLVEAGAVITAPGCGACYGVHGGVLAPGEVCITASTRNFKGRMGSADAKIYMGSPATVTASAIIGYIAGPEALESAGADR